MSSEALIEAVCEGNVEKVVELLDQGAEINYVDDSDGWTPLLWAVKRGQHSCIETLLEYKLAQVNLNLTDASGNTPLHKAAYLGDAAAVTMLIKHGANKNVTNQMGYTPYQLAEMFGQDNCMNLLNACTG